MNSPVEQIKERLNIVDVVSSYVKLEKSGIHFRARCPFHNEKTPSFFVSPERNNYHCFGCGKGGDIFSFVQEIEGLTFPETIKVLADKAGIVLSKYEKQQEDDDSVLYKALSLSAKYFEAVLKKFPSGVEYLKARGITDETIANFAVGYAPDGWRNLSSFLTSRGIPEEVQERAGLVIKSERGHYDRFRGRIMFPICNATGKVVGFSGRIFPEKLDEPMSAKYVNSPETKVYNKSRILFGYDKAKRAIAKTGRAIIVEGQMDLLMAHQSGSVETVAVSGTALTSYHLSLIKRFTEKVIFAFDADEAGFKASERGVLTSLDSGMDVLVARLPKGQDPADLIKENSENWKKYTDNAKHFIEVYLGVLKESYTDERTFKNIVAEKVIPHIARIKSPIDRAHFITLTARTIGSPEEAVASEVSRKERELKSDNREVVGSALIQATNISRREAIMRALSGLAYAKKDKDPEVFEKIKKRIETDFETEKDLFDPGSDEELNTRVFESELQYKDKDPDKEIEELFKNLEMETIKETLLQLTKELDETEKEKDVEKSNAVMNKIREAKTKLEQLFIN